MSKIPTENSPNLRNDVIDACQVASGGFVGSYWVVDDSYGMIYTANKKISLRSPCRNNNGFLDGLESYYVRNYGGTHNDYSGPESDGSDVDNGSCGRSSPIHYGSGACSCGFEWLRQHFEYGLFLRNTMKIGILILVYLYILAFFCK